MLLLFLLVDLLCSPNNVSRDQGKSRIGVRKYFSCLFFPLSLCVGDPEVSFLNG